MKDLKFITRSFVLAGVLILVHFIGTVQVKMFFRAEVKWWGESFMVSHVPALSACNGMDNGQGDGPKLWGLWILLNVKNKQEEQACLVKTPNVGKLEVYTYAKVTLLTHMKTLWTRGFFPFGDFYYFDSKGDFFLQMCDIANATSESLITRCPTITVAGAPQSYEHADHCKVVGFVGLVLLAVQEQQKRRQHRRN